MGIGQNLRPGDHRFCSCLAWIIPYLIWTHTHMGYHGISNWHDMSFECAWKWSVYPSISPLYAHLMGNMMINWWNGTQLNNKWHPWGWRSRRASDLGCKINDTPWYLVTLALASWHQVFQGLLMVKAMHVASSDAWDDAQPGTIRWSSLAGKFPR